MTALTELVYGMLKTRAKIESTGTRYFYVLEDNDTIDLRFTDNENNRYHSVSLTESQILDMLKTMTVEQVVESWIYEAKNFRF